MDLGSSFDSPPSEETCPTEVLLEDRYETADYIGAKFQLGSGTSGRIEIRDDSFLICWEVPVTIHKLAAQLGLAATEDTEVLMESSLGGELRKPTERGEALSARLLSGKDGIISLVRIDYPGYSIIWHRWNIHDDQSEMTIHAGSLEEAESLVDSFGVQDIAKALPTMVDLLSPGVVANQAHGSEDLQHTSTAPYNNERG